MTAAPTVLTRHTEPAPPELAVGTIFRDCPTCPLMIVLPPGDFVQGTPAGAPPRGAGAPVSIVFIAASQHEVTVGEFAEFVEDHGARRLLDLRRRMAHAAPT